MIYKMLDISKMKLAYNLSRSISICNINLNKYASREGKFMTKIMRGEQAKRKWYAQPQKVSPEKVAPSKPALPPNNRRNTVLNKIFMKYITDLMATGEIAPDIVGKGIEISRVSVTPDFQQVNVFWLANDTEETDKVIEETLTKAEGPLRHELSQLRVMGVVPIIKFVRDRQYIRFIEIDRRLAVADFGEDFVPTDRTLRLKTTPVLNLKLPTQVWNNIQNLESDMEEEEVEIVEEPLPEMRNDVLGLDQARIMTKIKSSMDKSRAAFQNRSLNRVNPVNSGNVEESSTVINYLTVREKNAAFSEFLSKRQLEEKRRKKYEMNKNIPEDDLYLFDRHDVDADDDEVFDIDIDSEEIEER